VYERPSFPASEAETVTRADTSPGGAAAVAGSILRTYRRVRFGEPVIVVSGLPRSGTSMMMRMLEAGGVELMGDGIRIADESNPLGYFEDERVKTLENDTDRSWIRASRGKALKVICSLLRHLPVTNNYKVVFMERDLSEVIASQNKMLARAGEGAGELGEDDLRRLFENHLWKARYVVTHRSCFQPLFVAHGDVMRSPVDQARRVAAFLGRPLDVDRMAAAVDERLYRNRKT
jgi:hypothetical protein